MRLGLSLGYQTAWSTPADHLAMAREADRLGYSVVWAAEAYGSDTVSMLAWIAGQTERIDLGAAVMQIPARTPAMTAMTAATLDTLSGKRFRLGLGVSGPQVSEGWHGVRFARPLSRTREYVDVVKLALSRQPVAYQGEHHVLPLPGGAGKPLKLGFRPVRTEIPVYLAAVGPKNLELAGEIADGWLGIFVAPDAAADQLRHIETGRAKRGLGLDGFDVVASVPVVLGDDLDACADVVRPYAALYVGGMGSREQNFYNGIAVRMGYPEEAKLVQDLYLSKQPREAAAAVPRDFIERTSLIGTRDRVIERIREYAAAGVGTLSISPYVGDLESGLETLRVVAGAFAESGVAS
ncbi:LLM class F420-dependent oxidoreductase [Actinoplanes couchii]|uniref:LLM class F420-dependent oxidoreductase n=1 Tax=Actinoplanes couchii TaxID=403638 RepID=A0ABQ3X0Y4_9ACTN|nr:LLM class F420-dependent oxidoreductase [Actinoplanes couchii]MDR6316520.1 F420-dependent oxidoreductase-like protein [Actinoplanes couchii]GID52136.1 LLM class F420-dependent oxidoreductase [Actinoplanes couchii]